MLERAPTVCMFCDEPVRQCEAADTTVNGEPAHRECIIRSVLGSVAHAQKRCGCFIPGSVETDPEGMTKREAARAAVAAHQLAAIGGQRLNRWGVCPECGCKEFNPGPRGGTAQNIRCAECGAKYWYAPPFQPVHVFNADEVYNMSVRHTLPFPEDV